MVLLVEYVVLPQLVGARAALDLLVAVDRTTLVVALVLEACSLLSYSALTRSLLAAPGRPAYDVLLRIDLTGLGASHVVPGGGATAAALRYRLLTHAGVDRRDAVTTTAIQTGIGVGALTAVFGLGLGAALSAGVDHAVFEVAGALALVVVLIIGLVLVALLRDPMVTRGRLGRGLARVPRVDAAAVDRMLAGLTTHLRSLLLDRPRCARIAVYGLGNWLLDAAALWTCLRAFGHTEDVGLLLAVYGLVNLLALLPVTPGGLGIVEGILVPTLVSFGSPHAVALMAVLTWRLVEFWLPIPLSWLTYLSLRLGVLRDRDLTDVRPERGVPA